MTPTCHLVSLPLPLQRLQQHQVQMLQQDSQRHNLRFAVLIAILAHGPEHPVMALLWQKTSHGFMLLLQCPSPVHLFIYCRVVQQAPVL